MHVVGILELISLSSPPFQDPVPALINALLTLDLGGLLKDLVTAVREPRSVQLMDRLLEILDRGLTDYKDTELEVKGVPLLTLLRQIYDEAPSQIKRHIEESLLPSDTDRERPLGKSDSLPSKLLRLSISPAAPNFGPSISALLFELSGKDPVAFVHKIGYGYAAGFLMSHKLPIPTTENQNDRQEDAIPDINPITGQRRDMEPTDMAPEMTNEEKEREAERLFVLFER